MCYGEGEGSSLNIAGKKMKPFLFSVIFLVLVVTATFKSTSSFAESDFSRYQVIIDRSPFGSSGEVSLPVISPEAAKEINRDYLLTGIITIGSVKKVVIEDKKKNEHYYLNEGDSIDRLKIFSIDVKEEEVILLMEGKLIRIGFKPKEEGELPLRSPPKRIPRRRKPKRPFPPREP